MSISSVSSNAPAYAAKAAEAKEVGPENDGDSDDAGAKAAPVQSAPPPGLGQIVDKTA